MHALEQTGYAADTVVSFWGDRECSSPTVSIYITCQMCILCCCECTECSCICVAVFGVAVSAVQLCGLAAQRSILRCILI